MVTQGEFARLLRDALLNLYDPIYLENHPLGALLSLERGPGETTGEALRRMLRDAIEVLRPPASQPQGRPEWLGYHILREHYIRSSSPQEVCQELSISQPTFYRRQRKALLTLARILWERQRPESLSAEGSLDLEEILTDAQARNRAVSLASQAPGQWVDLKDLVRGVVQTVAPLVHRQGVALRVQVPDTLPAAYADPSVLRQIIICPLVEYLKAFAGGTVVLAVTVQEQNTRWQLQGIARSGRPAKLGPTCSMRPPTADDHGIALSRDLLSLYGGRMGYEEGSEPRPMLWFTIPTFRSRTVLIVEDDPQALELYRRHLQAAHYIVWEAYNAEQAEAAMSAALPDLVLLDVMLPRRDGWTLLNALKANPRTVGIPVVVCSVVDQPDLAMALGADEVITKPISAPHLLAAVGRWLHPAHKLGSAHPRSPAGV